MAALREAIEGLGFGNVRTYIQSGNVVFTSTKKPSAAAIEAAIEDAFGFDIAVMVRAAADLDRVLAANPFPDADPSKLHVGFLASAVRDVRSLDHDRYPPEEFSIAGAEVYFHLPNGMGRAKVPDYVGRAIGVAMTVRNWKTVTTLAAMAKE